MKGYITAEDRFLFPDTDLGGSLPAAVKLHLLQNGRAGVQLLIPCPAAEGKITVSTREFTVEYFRLHKIPCQARIVFCRMDERSTREYRR